MPKTNDAIAVIGDYPLLREAVSSTLQSVDGFEVIAQGESYQDALKIAYEAMPDIICWISACPAGVSRRRETYTKPCHRLNSSCYPHRRTKRTLGRHYKSG